MLSCSLTIRFGGRVGWRGGSGLSEPGYNGWWRGGLACGMAGWGDGVRGGWGMLGVD